MEPSEEGRQSEEERRGVNGGGWDKRKGEVGQAGRAGGTSAQGAKGGKVG